MSNRSHNAYMSSNWNRLDGFVVLVSVLGAFFPNLTMFRAFRAIRPLRIAVRIDQVKVVLGALVRAVPAMLNVMVFCFSFWFVLGILGTTFFMGQFRSCHCKEDYEPGDQHTDPGAYEKLYYGDTWGPEGEEREMKTREDCRAFPGECEWRDEWFNFNDIFQAIHSLFVLATMSNWNEIMYNGVDTNGMDTLPKVDNTFLYSIYFIIIIIVCAFFSLNLIVSVVVDNFNRIKDENDGSALRTETQERWVQLRRLTDRMGLVRVLHQPEENWRLVAYRIVEYYFFDPFILGCIILNTMMMCIEHYGISEELNIMLKIFDYIFIAIFTVEAILKITAYGWGQYWADNWNKFDFIIVLVGLVSLFDLFGGAGVNVLRLFRVGRVLRLINKAQTLKTLFLTLLYSIPSLWNIGLLLFVIFFIYAIVGMELFGDIVTPDTWFEQHDDKVTFLDFTLALNVLYRVGSGDGWTSVYIRYLRDIDFSKIYQVYIYFMTFFVVGSLVMINLFIAVILDLFDEEQRNQEKMNKLWAVKEWTRVWMLYDTNADGWISVKNFIETLKRTPASKKDENGEELGGPGLMSWNEDDDILQLKRSASISSGHVTSADKQQSESEKEVNLSKRQILEHLLKLNLLVELRVDHDTPFDGTVQKVDIWGRTQAQKKDAGGIRDAESSSSMNWCVEYTHALVVLSTRVTQINLEIPELKRDQKYISQWYAETYGLQKLYEELIREDARRAQNERLLPSVLAASSNEEMMGTSSPPEPPSKPEETELVPIR